MRTRFNRPILMALLMLFAGGVGLYVYNDGFKHRHQTIGFRAGSRLVTESDVSGEPNVLRFTGEDSQLAFDRAVRVWMQKSGYEKVDKTWKQATGKVAYSQGLGVREDLRVYVRRISRGSYQAWGIGDPTSEYKLVQIYRMMSVSEWKKEDADKMKEIFDKEANAMENLCRLAQTL